MYTSANPLTFSWIYCTVDSPTLTQDQEQYKLCLKEAYLTFINHIYWSLFPAKHFTVFLHLGTSDSTSSVTFGEQFKQ